MATKKIPSYTVNNIEDFPFEELNFETLSSISSTVNGILAQRREAAKATFIQETINKSQELGLDLNFDDLMKQAKVKKGKRKPIGSVEPKYQFKDVDTNELIQITGRGRCPTPLKKLLEQQGITYEEFKADPKNQI